MKGGIILLYVIIAEKFDIKHLRSCIEYDNMLSRDLIYMDIIFIDEIVSLVHLDVF